MKLRILLAALTLGFSFGCGSSSPSSPTPAPSGNTVSIVMNSSGLGANAYSPNPITVAVGASVTWVNNDTVIHTATSETGLFDTGNIAANGGQVTKTFSTVGSFPYRCTIHPGMTGTVRVQ